MGNWSFHSPSRGTQPLGKVTMCSAINGRKISLSPPWTVGLFWGLHPRILSACSMKRTSPHLYNIFPSYCNIEYPRVSSQPGMLNSAFWEVILRTHPGIIAPPTGIIAPPTGTLFQLIATSGHKSENCAVQSNSRRIWTLLSDWLTRLDTVVAGSC